MSFWIFKKKGKQEGNKTLELPLEDKRAILEEDLQFLIDYFYEIARKVSRIEHTGTLSPKEMNEIAGHASAFRKVIQKLRKSEPEFLAYWNNFLSIAEDFVYAIKKTLPSSSYEIPLGQQRVEKIGRLYRRSASEFSVMLDDVKKKLSKHYKRDFKISWPKRHVFS